MNKTPDGRQYPLHALYKLTPDNSGDGFVIGLPPGAVIVSGAVNVTTAGASGVTLSVKDNASTPNSLFGDVAASTAGPTTLAAASQLRYYPAGAKLTVALSAADPDAEAFVDVAYLVDGRTNEVFAA